MGTRAVKGVGESEGWLGYLLKSQELLNTFISGESKEFEGSPSQYSNNVKSRSRTMSRDFFFRLDLVFVERTFLWHISPLVEGSRVR